MGKAKKGKRSGKDEDIESDVDIEEQTVTEPVKSKAKASKESKKKNNKVSDDVDDLANDMEELKVEKPKEKKGKKGKKPVNDESDDEVPVKSRGKGGKKPTIDDDDFGSDTDSEIKPKSKTKKGKKASFSDEEIDIIQVKSKQKGGKGGFSFLEVEGDDNEAEEDEAPRSDDDSEKVESVERSKGNKGKGSQKQEPQGKKGKKSRKKYDSDEELERELAALEMEYAGKKVEPAEPAKEESKKKITEEKPKKTAETKEREQEHEEGSGMKTAAQKKKEKKEREKLKKMAQKKAEVAKKTEGGETTKESQVPAKVEEEVAAGGAGEMDEEDEDGKKKKKKGGKDDVKGKKGPAKKAILAMQEALRIAKEEEERLQREEEERIRQEELAEAARLAQIQLEHERKEKKKLKEKQRKERLKAEGKFLTEKQKQDRARAQQLLESLKAKGLEIPEAGQKKTRVKQTGRLPKSSKLQQQSSTEDKKEDDNGPEQVELEIIDQQKEQAKEAEKKIDEVKDSWDADSSEDEEAEEDKSEETSVKPETTISKVANKNNGKTPVSKKNVAESSGSESESGSDSDSSSDDDSDESIDERLTDAEKKKERARLRIQARRNSAEKKRTLDNLRAAVVCVLGHVDTGKTKILDKLRRTNVQDGEAGGITQQIGATNVPIDAIRESTRHVKGFADKTLRIPGLLIIDTPGHESFSNLRNRGSSLCDISVLVIDIMHGLEPQTIESINILKSKKCPFVVALNKIDRLYDWETMNRKDVQDIINAQGISTKLEFEKRSKDVILQLAEQGLNAALFYENPDPRSYVSLVPTSAITGEGMGNLLALLVDACQGPLAKRLMYSDELQATVLEVKQLPGHGTTIDCILVNGTLREGDTVVIAGTDGPIVTQIRALLMPQPLKELRVKNSYVEYREIKAAQGVKITAKDLEKAIAGLNLAVAQKPDEVELLKEEISQELSKALGSMKISERGVFVQASTLGALEALLDFLRSSKIPYAGIRIGPVVKKDVMKASIMLEHDSQYATILAFDVKIERDAQDLADSLGVKIFQADIIYHLFDKFTAYREELKQRMRDENKHIAVFPCKLRVLPQFIFNSRDPIVVGVMVEAGIVKEGTPVCVPSKDFVELGVVTSVEYNHKPVESARKGQEVCIKIEPIPGEAPKMFGRHFDEKDLIISKISRQSIDACKNYFRDDLLKPDWHLMVELKKLFEIL